MTATPPTVSRLFSFIGGSAGPWRIESLNPVVGESLPVVSRVSLVEGLMMPPADGSSWLLRGITSNERYVNRDEKVALVNKQEGLGREGATRAALIPIRKNAAWWALAQDDRRRIFEAQSRHIEIGLKYLPAVARRLHHCRDLGSDEPSIFWLGSSTLPPTRWHSRSSCKPCALHRNGNSLTAKWISGWSKKQYCLPQNRENDHGSGKRCV